LIDDDLGLRSPQSLFHGGSIECVHNGYSRTHVDELLRICLVAGHARDRVPVTNQCGDQWLADRSTRTGNKDFHMKFSRLTFVVCTAGWNPSICSSSSSPGELVRLASAGGNEVPKTPLRAESEER
jgi:hypothetical protein